MGDFKVAALPAIGGVTHLWPPLRKPHSGVDAHLIAQALHRTAPSPAPMPARVFGANSILDRHGS